MPSETALQLDTEAAGYTGSEALHFGGFPGLWAPGVPVAVSELRFDTEEAALERVAALELPLAVVTVDHGSAPMPGRPNHALNSEQADLLTRELDETPKRPSHKELDQIAADTDLAFPDDVKTIDQKLAFLEEARNPAETRDEDEADDEDGDA